MHRKNSKTYEHMEKPWGNQRPKAAQGILLDMELAHDPLIHPNTTECPIYECSDLDQRVEEAQAEEHLSERFSRCVGVAS